MVRAILIVLAVVLAALAGWMVRVYLSNQEARLAQWAAAQKPEPLPTSEVLVAANTIDLTATLSSGDLRWQSWPDNGINAHYIVRKIRPDAIEKLTGAAARQPIFQGEPITEDKLIMKEDGGFLAAVLPRNGRAITLKIDEASGVGGLLLPGDHVDVILTHDVPTREGDGQGGIVVSKRFVSETIVKDLMVLAIDLDFKHEDKTAKLSKTVTLSVTPAQAEAIALGRAMGVLTLSLRSAFGGSSAETRAQPYTTSGDISNALRSLAAPPLGSAPAAASSSYTVTIFHGLSSEVVTLAH
jgi:pilus assembly protein CpaB